MIAGLCAEVVESASDEPDGRTETVAGELTGQTSLLQHYQARTAAGL